MINKSNAYLILINRMETFHTCATQMLREFRALLHISPIPINSHRLLQLISLNMYAIECNALNCTELKGKSKHFIIERTVLLTILPLIHNILTEISHLQLLIQNA